MGLDVYLYKHENLEEQLKLEEAFQEEFDAWFKETFGKVTDWGPVFDDPRYKAKKEELAAKYECTPDGECTKYEKYEVELPSKTNPEHNWSIGYWRSSYNDAGTNNVLRSMGLPTLYDIVKPEDHAYYVQPDWEATKARATEVLGKYTQMMEQLGDVHVEAIDMRDVEAPSSKAEALEVYKKHLEEQSVFDSYMDSTGHYCIQDPMHVRAFIYGRKPDIFDPTKYVPTLYLVVADKSGEASKYYAECLAILIETCEYVLSVEDEGERKKYYLHWSA